MNYADIKLATKTLLGETSDGSGTFGNPDQYPNAIQWAQQQLAQLLGLTYAEAPVTVDPLALGTGETVYTLLAPADMIIPVRIESLPDPPIGLGGIDEGGPATIYFFPSIDGGTPTTVFPAYAILDCGGPS